MISGLRRGPYFIPVVVCALLPNCILANYSTVAMYTYERDVTIQYFHNPNPNPNHKKGTKCRPRNPNPAIVATAGCGYYSRVRVLGPTFSTLFMVRIRVRVILNCDVTFICVHRYGGIISEDASLTQQRIGPKIVLKVQRSLASLSDTITAHSMIIACRAYR